MSIELRGSRIDFSPSYDVIEGLNLAPLDVYKNLSTGESAGMKESFLLESASGGEKIARFSFIGANPFLRLKSRGKKIELGFLPEFRDYAEKALRLNCGELEEEKGLVRGELSEGRDVFHVVSSLVDNIRFISIPLLPRFVGGAVGYSSYDVVRFLENVPDSHPELEFPDAYFVLPLDVVCFDRLGNKVFVFSDDQELVDRVRNTKHGEKGDVSVEKARQNTSKEEFCEMVERAKKHIVEGDIFQVVLSQRFSSKYEGNPLDIYRRLREINPSPYMFYLNYEDAKLVGASPEMLVRVENSRVDTRPIAGTRSVGKTPEEDERLERELLADEKERAEHIMLVDLGRNDLGRVCEYGSVKVNEFMIIEKYSHVQHIVSNVTGVLRSDKDRYDVLRSVFPAGTVSGAPKVRAMEIIDELEKEKRGPYAGCVGYFDYQGNMDTAITIRTIVLGKDELHVQAGAGIVADSVPEYEYAETVKKAKAMLEALTE